MQCPICKSHNLQLVGANRQGFSGGKAVAGAFLLGPIGLLAGLIGKNEVQSIEFICMDCGKHVTEKQIKQAESCKQLPPPVVSQSQPVAPAPKELITSPEPEVGDSTPAPTSYCRAFIENAAAPSRSTEPSRITMLALIGTLAAIIGIVLNHWP